MGTPGGNDRMVRVSEVTYLPKQKVRVVLDNGSGYTILKSMYHERPLSVGDELDAAEYADWILKRQYRSALDKAVSMLALRARSRGEISQKLLRTGYSEETVNMVMYKLEKEGFLDDQDFAEQWTSYRSGQKIGPRRISMELRQKGVSAADTERALEDISEEELMESAVCVARRYLSRTGKSEEPAKVRQKAVQAVVRRGYDWDLARQAVDQVLGQDDFE